MTGVVTHNCYYYYYYYYYSFNGFDRSESLLDALFFVCCTIKAAACLARGSLVDSLLVRLTWREDLIDDGARGAR